MAFKLWPSSFIVSVAMISLGGIVGLPFYLKQGSIDGDQAANRQNENLKTGVPVAVVELFTSEGCSSCPPADENLRRISNQSIQRHRNVFTLSFHVDYWDSLGWKDPFSQKAFSERQREYARAGGGREVYTPQMLVNGRYDLVGSNKALSDQAINAALDIPVKHDVKLLMHSGRSPSTISLQYNVTEIGGDSVEKVDGVINIALVSDSESIEVVNGENGGRRLSHVSVVRSLKVVPLHSRRGTLEFDITSVIGASAHFVGYVQSRKTKEITGATSVGISSLSMAHKQP
jgi:hypothetical protein